MKQIDIKQLNLPSWRRVKDVIRLRLFELKDGSSWSLPAAIIAGRRPGSTVTIVAGQHGDEWNGIFIAHRLFEEIEPQDLEGTLVILPIANPFAFLQKSRVGIIDQIDMNRSYGRDGERQPTILAASLLFEEICRQSGYVVDLHSGGPGSYLPNAGIAEQGRFSLALHFNTGNVIVAFKDHGTLMAACERHSVAAFAIQVGRALDVDYRASEKVVGGIVNFLRGVGLISEPPETDQNQQLFTDKQLLLAPESGFITIDVSLGDEVAAGQKAGSIEPLFKEPIDIIAPEGGRVLYARHEAIISRGDSVIHVAKREAAG